VCVWVGGWLCLFGLCVFVCGVCFLWLGGVGVCVWCGVCVCGVCVCVCVVCGVVCVCVWCGVCVWCVCVCVCVIQQLTTALNSTL